MGNFLQNLSLIWNIVIFTIAGVVVWRSGVRLSKIADKIIDRTGVSEVFIGTLGLALITSLPEVSTTVSASLMNNIDMAVNNLFGSIALQIALLVVADVVIGKVALSGSLENPVSRLQAICLNFLLALAIVAILFKDFAVFYVGIWSLVLFCFYIFLSYVVNYFKKIKWWLTKPEERKSIGEVKKVVSERLEKQNEELKEENENLNRQEKESLGKVLGSRLGLLAIIVALLILTGGYFVATSADAIAQKTGMDSNLMGFFFVSLTTSLPELSTSISAARLKRYRMAFSNIFGTNMLNVGLVLLADLFYFEGAALEEVKDFAAVGAGLGILLTSIYLGGLTIKFKKTYFRMGVDSILVLIFYLAGIFVLYKMRNV